MKPSEYQEIGHYLRDSRESLRVKLDQAAGALHIRVKYLRALENGDFQELPGKAYTRGYIKNYAEYLRLDSSEVLKAYGFVAGPKNTDFFVPEPTQRQHLPSRRLLWLSFLGLVLAYAGWYFFVHDRTSLDENVAQVPAGFAHLPEKPEPKLKPHAADNTWLRMDKPWAVCLREENMACLAQLHVQTMVKKAMPDGLDAYEPAREKSDDEDDAEPKHISKTKSKPRSRPKPRHDSDSDDEDNNNDNDDDSTQEQ